MEGLGHLTGNKISLTPWDELMAALHVPTAIGKQHVSFLVTADVMSSVMARVFPTAGRTEEFWPMKLPFLRYLSSLQEKVPLIILILRPALRLNGGTRF